MSAFIGGAGNQHVAEVMAGVRVAVPMPPIVAGFRCSRYRMFADPISHFDGIRHAEHFRRPWTRVEFSLVSSRQPSAAVLPRRLQPAAFPGSGQNSRADVRHSPCAEYQLVYSRFCQVSP